MEFGTSALFVAAAPLAVFLAARFWQHTLFGVFVLLVFEGALRKWVLPSAQGQIYLIKDVLLVGVYLGFLLHGRKNSIAFRDAGPIKVIIMIAFFFGCIEVLNPNSPSVLVGLIGLKAYFLYIPAAFIFPYAFESKEQLLRLIRAYLIMAIPVAVLGFAQVRAGPTSVLNTYLSHSEDAAILSMFGENSDIVRTSGTFSYITGYATFVGFIAFLAIGYIMGRGWRVKGNIGPLVALLVTVGAMFTTGSRSVVFGLVAMIPFIIWLGFRGGLLTPRILMRLCVLTPVLLFAATYLSPRATEAFLNRSADTSTSYALSRAIPLFEAIDTISTAPAFGSGIGTTNVGAIRIMGAEWPYWLGYLPSEDEWSRIVIELGIIGFILLVLLRILIFAFAFRCATSFRDPAYLALAIVLTAHLALSITGEIVNDPTANLYYWGSFGLLLTMRRLERCARNQLEASFGQNNSVLLPAI